MRRLKRTNMACILVACGVAACCLRLASGVPVTGANEAVAGEAQESLGVPEALKGFRGMLVGVIAKKGDREFIIEVVKITRTWKDSKTEDPQAAVDKKVVCELWPEGRMYERHRRTLDGLKRGDRVLVEPFHLKPKHDHLTVVEELKKLEKETETPKAKPGKKSEKGTLGVPEALRGFKGMLVATIIKKGSVEFIIKVEKINRTWNGNKAENPQAAIGKQAVCELWKKGRLFEKQRRTLADLKAGDRVLIEPFHLEPDHDHLTVVEELRKVD